MTRAAVEQHKADACSLQTREPLWPRISRLELAGPPSPPRPEQPILRANEFDLHATADFDATRIIANFSQILDERGPRLDSDASRVPQPLAQLTGLGMRLLALTKFLEEFDELQNLGDEFDHFGQILDDHPKVVVVHINSNWRTKKSPHEWRAIKKPLFRAACICWAQLPQRFKFYPFCSACVFPSANLRK